LRQNKDSAILAVGSSTFPESHWKTREKLNKSPENKLKLKLDLNYQDIDLRIIPAKPCPVWELEKALGQVLKNGRYDFSQKTTTTLGARIVTSYSDLGKAPCTWVDFSYGLHCITTNLKNKTPIDLILDFVDNPELPSAEERIAFERRNNYAFSVLYIPQILRE